MLAVNKCLYNSARIYVYDMALHKSSEVQQFPMNNSRKYERHSVEDSEDPAGQHLHVLAIHT